MGKRRDLTGRVFGDIQVLEFVGTKRRNSIYLCLCGRCGKVWPVLGFHLTQGQTSCRCGHPGNGGLRGDSVKHGMMHGTKEYSVWQGMIQRCHNPKDDGWKWYGGRGIKVCDRWRFSFEAFYEDVGPIPEGLTLDRYPDKDGDYKPSNVRLATMKEQTRNKRNNVWFTAFGRTMIRPDWARKTGISLRRLEYFTRRKGYSIEEIVRMSSPELYYQLREEERAA